MSWTLWCFLSSEYDLLNGAWKRPSISVSQLFTQILIEAPASSLFHLCLSDSVFLSDKPAFVHYSRATCEAGCSRVKLTGFGSGPMRLFPVMPTLTVPSAHPALPLFCNLLQPKSRCNFSRLSPLHSVSSPLLGNCRQKARPAASNVLVLVDIKYLRAGWESGSLYAVSVCVCVCLRESVCCGVISLSGSSEFLSAIC